MLSPSLKEAKPHNLLTAPSFAIFLGLYLKQFLGHPDLNAHPYASSSLSRVEWLVSKALSPID